MKYLEDGSGKVVGVSKAAQGARITLRASSGGPWACRVSMASGGCRKCAFAGVLLDYREAGKERI